ncbi:MAG: hypothetical protein Q9225_003079 [Loekoesia sp. 1 TL-2023]
MVSDLAKLTPQQLAEYPIRPPPSGVLSNFGDAADRNAPFFVVDTIFLVIMVVFFLNRIYTKQFIVKKFSWDDPSPL